VPKELVSEDATEEMQGDFGRVDNYTRSFSCVNSDMDGTLKTINGKTDKTVFGI
jgi:hypothetical protein